MRSALCKNEGWANFDDGDCDAGPESDFRESFASAETNAPEGLGSVVCKVWFFGMFEALGVCKAVGGRWEVDENFELILDIHEFRLPGEPTWPDLGSLELFAGGWLCDMFFSEAARCRISGL